MIHVNQSDTVATFIKPWVRSRHVNLKPVNCLLEKNVCRNMCKGTHEMLKRREPYSKPAKPFIMVSTAGIDRF